MQFSNLRFLRFEDENGQATTTTTNCYFTFQIKIVRIVRRNRIVVDKHALCSTWHDSALIPKVNLVAV